MDELSPSSTPGSRPPPRLPPSVVSTVDLNSDDYEKKASRQRRLSFGVPETPAASTDDIPRIPDPAAAAGIPDPAAAAGNSAQATNAALAELTTKLNSLTEVVSALAKTQARPAPKAKEPRTAGDFDSDSAPDFSSDPDSDSDSDATSDSDRKTATLRETGPACVSIFCRSIDYTATDPDRISDRHDVDGIDSDYRRISDKRPLILSDLTDNTEAHGSQLKEVAARLCKRISKGLNPQPSPQCAIGLSIFAMHDQLSDVVQCRLQSAIMAARNCTTRREVKALTKICREKRRVPSAMLQRAATISNSPLLKAIRAEAANTGDRLIHSIWEFIVAVISLDRNPAVTLATVRAQWQTLEGGDVEAALFRELSFYNAAADLLGTNKGAKPFCSFEDRIENILRCRTTTDCDVKSTFSTRLELDQLDPIDLDWDDVWDRVIDAEAAATRKNKRGNHNSQRPPSADHSPTDHIMMTCLLHGQCSHETTECKTLRKYPDLPASTVRILKHNGICVIGYGEKHPQGDCGRQDCKFKHAPPNVAEAILAQPSQQSIGNGSTSGPPAQRMRFPGTGTPTDTRIVNPAIGSPALPLPAPDDDDSLYASYAIMSFPDDY